MSGRQWIAVVAITILYGWLYNLPEMIFGKKKRRKR